MKVVDIERVVILMRFIQYGWDEERKKSFDDNLRMMLETQCEDLDKHDAKVRADAITEVIKMAKFNIHFENIAEEERFMRMCEQMQEGAENGNTNSTDTDRC